MLGFHSSSGYDSTSLFSGSRCRNKRCLKVYEEYPHLLAGVGKDEPLKGVQRSLLAGYMEQCWSSSTWSVWGETKRSFNKGCHLQKMLYRCTLLVVTTKPEFGFRVKLQCKLSEPWKKPVAGEIWTGKAEYGIWSRIPAIPLRSIHRTCYMQL